MSATRQAIASRATGVQFFSAFGAVWLLGGLQGLGLLSPLPVVAVVIGCAALFVAATRVSRRARALPAAAEDPVRAGRIRRSFLWVNVAQWVAIFVVVQLFANTGLSDDVMPAIGVIVGLHFLPLARVFGYPPHLVTGTLMILWSVAVVLLFPPAIVPGASAIGTGLLLVASAAYTLAGALKAEAQSRGLAPAAP